MITLTAQAVGRIREILENDHSAAGKVLRLGVKGGGCAGFEYAFSFDDKQEDDTVVEQDGLEIAIDPMSSIYLMGLQVDYTEDLSGAGFRFQNPNSSGSCGCGKSFAV